MTTTELQFFARCANCGNRHKIHDQINGYLLCVPCASIWRMAAECIESAR